eukprot:TRINITY_DN85304_c0_g1_i4.p1 TRINITY_DN85304_c0_g1~~TRINITY_DN85304_c0_g1_i4.p1  ORF type:complete len:188 (+),score=23.33 TRINITY_DN85304_c0_g1_i4:53-565(+)
MTNSLIIIGGFSTTVLNDVYQLEIETLTWVQRRVNNEVLSEIEPSPRYGHTSVLMETLGTRFIVIYGGAKLVNTVGTETPLQDIWVLNLSNWTWIRPNCDTIPPTKRFSHTAFLIASKTIGIWGGADKDDFPNELFSMELELTNERTLQVEIGRAVQQECRDRSRMPSSA